MKNRNWLDSKINPVVVLGAIGVALTIIGLLPEIFGFESQLLSNIFVIGVIILVLFLCFAVWARNEYSVPSWIRWIGVIVFFLWLLSKVIRGIINIQT